MNHAFFCTFLYRCRTTTSWNFLISRFVKDVNTRKRLTFSFSEFKDKLLEFHSRKIRQNLTNWTRWNRSEVVWSTANSLFAWRFRYRRRRRCLSSVSRSQIRVVGTVANLWSPNVSPSVSGCSVPVAANITVVSRSPTIPCTALAALMQAWVPREPCWRAARRWETWEAKW